MPLYGSETFHGFVFSAPPNQGGKAGLSAPIVRVPSLTRLRLSTAQPGIAAFAAAVEDAPVAVAATASAAAAAMTRQGMTSFRIVRLLEEVGETRARGYHRHRAMLHFGK